VGMTGGSGNAAMWMKRQGVGRKWLEEAITPCCIYVISTSRYQILGGENVRVARITRRQMSVVLRPSWGERVAGYCQLDFLDQRKIFL